MIHELQQEVDDYLGGVTIAGVLGGEADKQVAMRDQNSRQLAWLKRKRTSGSSTPWRPAKRHRRSSFQYSCHEHKGFKQFLERGLLHFQIPDLSMAGPARLWNRMSKSSDMASYVVSTICHWLYMLRLNCDPKWDFAHHVHRHVLGGLKAAGLETKLPLVLIRINISSSSYDEGLRWGQVSGALTELFENSTPEDCELFKMMVDEMLHEPAGRQFLCSEDPVGDLWEHLKTS